MDSFVSELYNSRKDQLEGYTFIDKEHLDEEFLKPGGKIKYFDLYGRLIYGGILIKILDHEMYTTLKFLLKNGQTFYTIYYSKFYIFYNPPPPPKPKKDKLRDCFTELLGTLDKNKK